MLQSKPRGEAWKAIHMRAFLAHNGLRECAVHPARRTRRNSLPTVHLMRHRPERRAEERAEQATQVYIQGIYRVYTGETRADEERRDTAWRGGIVGQNAAAFCPVSLG